eukprot:PITA_02419
MVHIKDKLQGLNVVVKSWERRKNAQQKKDLNDIRVALETLRPLMLSHLPSTEVWDQIQSLELKRKHILQKRELTWRLKSRALWIRDGDKNTIFFHRYANHRRKVNSIWEIFDAEEYQVWGVNEYPMMFDEEANSALYKAVSGGEILQVLKSLKGDKSPGPDGWTVELFTHFFDNFQEYLSDMVEE